MTSAAVRRDTSALPGVDETYAVFVHLNAEKSPLYRAILSVFVAERARFTLALRPSEIQAALVARDDAKLHLTLSSLVDRFEQLTSRAQSFMRGLQRTVDLHGISVKAFLAYKGKLIDYLERFIGELVVATNRIAEALFQLESAGVNLAFAAAACRELADALEPTPEGFAAAEIRWQQRWAGARRGPVSESTSTNSAPLPCFSTSQPMVGHLLPNCCAQPHGPVSPCMSRCAG